jgi:hypothetical protein
MWYFIVIVSLLYIGFFIWATIDYQKREKKIEKEEDRSVCRSEDSLEEYGKKMDPEDAPKCPEPEE